jgi:hypothetical protein
MCHPRSGFRFTYIWSQPQNPHKKAASLANQERRNSRGGVGHAKAGKLETKILETRTAPETELLGK